MIKKIFIILVLVIVLPVACLYVVGIGWLGGSWTPAQVVAGPRPIAQLVEEIGGDNPQILFGDLHSHTSYSFDAYLFNTSWMKGGGVVTPADACDFARYCSALDFWSINDHAEGLTPRVWADTVQSIRDCNDNAGDPRNPDMVSFVGWEWTNSNVRDVSSHYGHKNVMFRSWEPGQTPTRPIAASDQYIFTKAPAPLLGMLSFTDGVGATSDFGWYMEEARSTPICPDGVPAGELPDDCREVALTPTSLFKKLDEWGFDSIVIPHGLAWGTTNPLAGDFQTQMDEHQERYQKLLEVYSGHGNSELFVDFERIGQTPAGGRSCPPATENFTPCCKQAGEIARRQCADLSSGDCETQVAAAIEQFLAAGAPAGRKLFPEQNLDDWEGCGQLRGTFQPSSMYVPKLAAQYSLALGFDKAGQPKRAKFGLIGSSDGHQARPGASYKESNRLLYTDHKDLGRDTMDIDSFKQDKESNSFYYTGGLVAVHTAGRDRDSIWRALSNRNVYATSGNRIQVWFDLLNGPAGEVPMGTEILMTNTPRFRVKALGEFEQLPGCPDYATAALGEERLQSLCGGECYRPGGDRRKAISRIEIVRIRPQVRPDEKISPLIEDQWKVFQCAANGEGCIVEFDDPEYAEGGRSSLYYARVIQEAEPLISGDPFGCEYDDQGQCIKRNYCIGGNATPEKNCLAPAEPRAWTSPIFLEHR
ncbi:MAG: DUF3604 domain-containing protein [Halioglobus sp.]|nr:DUF3604 domain-containing protein [Halioglobus sp.]